MLYRDMSPRDLFMRRSTDEVGNTQWKKSTVVKSALEGKLCILDGIHRLSDDTLCSLASLTSDREVQLFDGRRLISHERFDQMINDLSKKISPLNNQLNTYDECYKELTKRGLRRVHPSFRLLALAEPPGKEKDRWLQSETLPMFSFEILPKISLLDKILFITEGNVSSNNINTLPADIKHVGIRFA